MLGDNPEKSKNPLKKAMRRRNAKTVQFAAPQYYDPVEFDYSEDEEGQDNQSDPGENGPQEESNAVQQDNHPAEPAAAAHLEIDTQLTAPTANGIHRTRSNDSLGSDQHVSPEKRSPSGGSPLESGEVQDDFHYRSSRKGVVRNTDSFYKDDTVETKKISLTPRLLRGDSDVNSSTDQIDVRQRPSLDTFDRISAEHDRPKDDKKKKEKKGMLSGLFKRKDKKARPGESDHEESEKVSEEFVRISPQARESQDSPSGRSAASPQRTPSKLQKQPPVKPVTRISPVQEGFQPKEDFQNSPTTMRPIRDESPDKQTFGRPQLEIQTNTQGQRLSSNSASPTEKKTFLSPITHALRHSPSNTSLGDDPVVKAIYSKTAKHRFDIDTADSEDDSTPTGATQQHQQRVSPGPRQTNLQIGADTDSITTITPFNQSNERMPPQPHSQPPPPPVADTVSSSEPPFMSPPSPSRSSSPSLVDVSAAMEADESTNATTTSHADAHTPSTSRSTPTWSDTSLRHYMDNDRDIRDLLIIIHDKSNVIPAGPDHPITGHLFVNEKTRLVEMQANLDTMLTGWLARKNTTLLSR